MRNSLAPALLFAAIAVAPAVRAQQEPSKLELYGGYSYTLLNYISACAEWSVGSALA